MANRSPEADRKPPPAELLEVPARLQEALDARGIKPAELARRTNMSTDRVTRFLKGESWFITAATALLWCKALRVRVGWLLAGELPRDVAIPVAVFVDDSPEADAALDALAAKFESRGYLLQRRQDVSDPPDDD